MSHPTWVRGLKPLQHTQPAAAQVAPYVGAWIETTKFSKKTCAASVAPYVGAWIETHNEMHDKSFGFVAP